MTFEILSAEDIDPTERRKHALPDKGIVVKETKRGHPHRYHILRSHTIHSDWGIVGLTKDIEEGKA